MSTPRKPDLDHLIRALTADGRPDELADRDAALASFRAASQRGTAHGVAGPPRGKPFRGLPARLTVIGAALAVAAGVIAAAYTHALPEPVQEVAHSMFAPLGVPDGQLTPGTVPSSGSTGITIATAGGKPHRTAPGGAARTPSPRPADEYLITVAVSRTRVAAGGSVTLAGRVTDHGRALAGVRVRLFERLAGSAQFELEGTSVTGPLGGFRLPSPPLTATAIFRVLGPAGVHSAAVKVAVATPKITARTAGAAGQAATG